MIWWAPSSARFNSPARATAVNAGTLTVTADNAMGVGSSRTTVAAGASLAFGGVNYTTPQPVTLNGTGVGGNGALRALNGDNSFAGPITLGSASTVNNLTGTLTLSGDLSTGG